MRRLHAEVLVLPAQLLGAGVEYHEVVDEFQQPRLAAHLQQMPVQQARLGRIRAIVFQPALASLASAVDDNGHLRYPRITNAATE